MDIETLDLLEFESVLDIFREFAQSEAGKKKVRSFRPSGDLETVRRRLAELAEASKYASKQSRINFRHLEDPTDFLASLKESNEVFTPADLLLLLDHFRLVEQLKTTFTREDSPRISSHLRDVQIPHQLVERISASIEENGEIKDSAHPDLKSVRKKATEIRNRVQTHLERFIKGGHSKHLIPDPFVTQRAGRYVVPVRTESQSAVPGIVHATSSSGATVFVEPFDAVELNNQQIYYRERESEIVREVMAELSTGARDHKGQIENAFSELGLIDALFACVDFQNQYRCCRPVVNQKGPLDLHNARHPLLLKSLGDENVVPISLTLSEESNVIVISGPNTGGKTVALKTVGLFSLMAQSGLPVPAERAEFSLLNNVYADIGDHQSIVQHLSTFSAHVNRIQNMLERYQPPALVLLDEVGRGTDPVYGAPLAIAIIDYFRQRGALLLATTHHGAVKTFSASTPGVTNASVRLDPETFEPTYEIELGVAGSSSGLEIADRLGFSSEIISMARTHLNEVELEVERYLEELQKELSALEEAKAEEIRKKAELESRKLELEREFEAEKKKEKARIEERLEKLGKEFEKEVSNYLKRIGDRERALEIREETQRKQRALKESFRRSTRQKKETAPESASREAVRIKPGDSVYHDFFQKKGQVISVEEDRAVLEIEGKRVPSKLNQISKIESRSVTREPAPQVRVEVVEDTDPELNLIGKTVAEANSILDKYLDRAFVSQLKEVRIIHGFGTGRLRKAVSAVLENHPHVQRFEIEGGATRVSLKS